MSEITYQRRRFLGIAAMTIATTQLGIFGSANGAPHPDANSYANKFSGRYLHRVINGGIGHNLPQEAPREFAQAIVEVDGY